MSAQLKILVVEDLPADAEFTLREVQKAGINHTAVRVDTKREFLGQIEEFAPDIILADYTMPEFSGLEALALAHERCPDTPFIFVSATIGEEIAIESLKRGAVDYILKTNLKRLGPAVERALKDVAERRARLRVERQFNETRIRFELFMRYLPGAAFIKDWRGRYQFVNRAWEEIRGREVAEVLGRTDGNLWPELAAQFESNEQLVLERNDTLRSIETFPRLDGVHHYMVQKFPILDSDGHPMLVGGIALDITDRMQLEARLEEREAGLHRAQIMAKLAHVITGPDGAIESWSGTLPEMIGVDPGRMPKNTREWLQVLHPDDRELFRAQSIAAAVGGARVDVDYRLRRADETLIHIRQTMEPMQGQVDADGKMRWFSTLQDVTEQHQAQDRIARLNRIHAILSGINSLIVRVRDRQQLFDEACRVAVEQANFGTAWIGTFDSAALTVTPVAWAGAAAQRIASIRTPWQVDVAKGMGVGSRAIREKRPAFDNDIAVGSTVNNTRRLEVMREGFRSIIALPFIAEGMVVGQLSLYSKEANFFTEDEVKLLAELAGNISFAIESIDRQERLEKLSRIRAVSAEINSAIIRIQEREALLRESCRIAAEHGKFEIVWVASLDVEKREIRPVAWSGIPAEIAQAMKWAPGMSAGYSMLAEVLETRQLAVRNDIEAAEEIGMLREEALKQGCRSTVCLPLRVDDNVVAAIILCAPGQNFFDANEFALLNEVASDISFALQSIARQEQLNYLAYYDDLTGLPNRTLLQDYLGRILRRAKDEGTKAAAVMCDIKRFSHVNETLGREAGDTLLREFGQRLKEIWPEADNMGRFSADCFGGIVANIKDASDIAHLIESPLATALSEPFEIGGDKLRIAVTTGIAIFPGDGGDTDALFKNAEAALKKAKAGGDKYLFYHSEMNAAVAEMLRLENNLRRAIDKEEFTLHYQPKLDLAQGHISGLEALIRWNDPEAGLVPPVKFIPLLEETGMILEVGAWAIQQALHDYREWYIRGLQPPRIAVNVSSVQLRQKDFVEVVSKAIKDSKAMPHGLDLEITESLLMQDIGGNIKKLKSLRDMGINIAIDDFGTGYSSLGYLARLPVNLLKIDRSFIITMAKDGDSMAIVSTIISLAHSLGMKVIAEGVETEEQSRFLKLLKCDEMQGYLFSKPLPMGQLTQMLEERRES